MGQCFIALNAEDSMAAHSPEGTDALTLRTTGIAALLVSIIAGITSTLLFAAGVCERTEAAVEFLHSQL